VKSLLIVFGITLLIIATPFIFEAIDDSITETATQAFAENSDTDNATVVLSRDAWNDDVQSITGVSSNQSDDSPTAYSYNSVSRAVVVTGLASAVPRTLTVEFSIDSTSLPAGIAEFLTILRWFWLFIIIGMAGGAIYAFFD